MSEFAQLLEESLSQRELRSGALIKATVVQVQPDFIVVNAGLKSEAIIPIHEFRNDKGQVDIKVGQTIDVVVEMVEDGFGETRLSREKAKRAAAWGELEKSH